MAAEPVRGAGGGVHLASRRPGRDARAPGDAGWFRKRWDIGLIGRLAVLALVGVGVVLVTGAPAGIGPVDVPDVGGFVDDDGSDADGPDADGADADHGGTADGEFNETEVEIHFLRYLNEERSERGLQNLSRRRVLTEMGENHSRDMAEKEYFSHTEPDGDTIADRYEDRGLLPECRLPIEGSNSYYPGAENIAQVWVDRTVRHSWNDGSTHVSDERDLAWFLFQSWMHSKGHREAMLVHSADEAGLGLAITDAGKVYASLELC